MLVYQTHKGENLSFCIDCNVIKTSGLETALLGLSCNMNQDISKMSKLANKMAVGKLGDSGELKFLESIKLSFILKMPTYLWGEFDTYRIGITKQSTSIMHTIHKRPLTRHDFEFINPKILSIVNENRLNYFKNKSIENLMILRRSIPACHFYTRVISTNFKTLKHMYNQRIEHKLPHWSYILDILTSSYCGNWIKGETLSELDMKKLKCQIKLLTYID
jgi:hypothetical protein